MPAAPAAAAAAVVAAAVEDEADSRGLVIQGCRL